MTLTVELMGARPRSDEQISQLFGDGWPAFITADQTVKQYIGTVRRLFSDLEIVLLGADDVPVAAGWAVPLQWDGEPAHLPRGYTDSLVRAVEGHALGEVPDTLVVMAAQVHPGRRGQGLAAEFLTAMRGLAAQRGWRRVIAPVRPTLKSRYPLTPIGRFATWVRDDGLLLDPWLRIHQRLGAEVIGTASASQRMTGTVEQWETWAEMLFPDSGDYVIAKGLSTVRIDRETDEGVYVEPNVWMRHQ